MAHSLPLVRRRLDDRFYGAPGMDPAAFRRRCAAQAVHELGRLMGLGHCLSPDCVMWERWARRESSKPVLATLLLANADNSQSWELGGGWGLERPMATKLQPTLLPARSKTVQEMDGKSWRLCQTCRAQLANPRPPRPPPVPPAQQVLPAAPSATQHPASSFL